jgi:hypothetical protein
MYSSAGAVLLYRVLPDVLPAITKGNYNHYNNHNKLAFVSIGWAQRVPLHKPNGDISNKLVHLDDVPRLQRHAEDSGL